MSEGGPGDEGDLRAVWTAYVVLGGSLGLDELADVLERGLPLPPGERDLLAAARATRA